MFMVCEVVVVNDEEQNEKDIKTCDKKVIEFESSVTDNSAVLFLWCIINLAPDCENPWFTI